MADDESPRPDSPSPEAPSAGAGQPPLGDALGNVLKLVLERGQSRVESVAQDGRLRLELRQLRKDRDAMYRKLGREVRRLLEAGELDHPGVARGVERISGLDERITVLEAQMPRLRPRGGGAGEGEPGPEG